MVAKLLVVFSAILLLSVASVSQSEKKEVNLTVSPIKINGTNKKTILPTRTSIRTQRRLAPQALFSGIFPTHKNIVATNFYVGEPASAENAFIANDQSAWDANWQTHFGGVDDPKKRNGFFPAGFIPKENPFYFALPYGEFTSVGLKANATRIYWFDSNLADGKSLLKNHWIKISANGKVAYAQWEDVGPNETDDVNYVFGTTSPTNSFGQKAGLDISPAVKDYLNGSDSFLVSWQFVNAAQVPSGPWKQIITSSDPTW